MKYLLTIFLLFSASACTKPVTRHSFKSLGTTIHVTYAGKQQSALDTEIESLFSTIHKEASLYDKDSPLSELNRGPVEHKKVSNLLCRLIATGLSFRDKTEGRFDITYKSQAAKDGRKNSIQTDCLKNEISIRNRNIFIDLNGLAAGFAADRAGEILEHHGIRDFIVDAGGEMLVCGTKHGSPWAVGIKDPYNKDRILKKIDLNPAVKCAGISTSGDYEKAGHILDPATGKPVEGAHSVTVVSADATSADVFSTGLSVSWKDQDYLKKMVREHKLVLHLLSGTAPTLVTY